MSLLSIITNRLPDLLEFAQGTWDIQHNNPTDLLNTLTNVLTTDDNWTSLDFDTMIQVNGIQESSVMTHPTETGGFRAVNKVKKPKIVRVKIAKGGNGYGIESAMDTVSKLQRMVSVDTRTNKQNQNWVQSAVNAWNDFKSSVTSAINTGLSWIDSSLGTDIFRSSLTGVANPYSNMSGIRPVEFRVITPFNMIEHLTLQKVDYTFRKETGRNMLILDLTLQEIISETQDSNFALSNVKNVTDSAKKNRGQVAVRGN